MPASVTTRTSRPASSSSIRPSIRDASLPSKNDTIRPDVDTPRSLHSRRNRRVSSAAMTGADPSAARSRSLASPGFPIGVAASTTRPAMALTVSAQLGPVASARGRHARSAAGGLRLSSGCDATGRRGSLSAQHPGLPGAEVESAVGPTAWLDRHALHYRGCRDDQIVGAGLAADQGLRRGLLRDRGERGPPVRLRGQPRLPIHRASAIGEVAYRGRDLVLRAVAVLQRGGARVVRVAHRTGDCRDPHRAHHDPGRSPDVRFDPARRHCGTAALVGRLVAGPVAGVAARHLPAAVSGERLRRPRGRPRPDARAITPADRSRRRLRQHSCAPTRSPARCDYWPASCSGCRSGSSGARLRS